MSDIEFSKAPEIVLNLAQTLIQTQTHHEQLQSEGQSIGFIFRNYAALKNGKAVFSETILVPEKLKPHIRMDFVIVLAEDEWNRASSAQREAELDHALCHCMYHMGRPKLRPHDVEEFAIIIKNYGPYRRDLERANSAFQWAAQTNLAGFQVAPTLVALDPDTFHFGE